MAKKTAKQKSESTETPSSYLSTKRAWVKFWVDEWLTGTTRFELDPSERSIFADLIILAGKSRFPGVIAAGEYGEEYRGYPIQYLAGTLVVPEELLERALEKCARSGKIEVSRNGTENVVITVVNFEKYQSEYMRQRKYRAKPEDDPEEFARRYGYLSQK